MTELGKAMATVAVAQWEETRHRHGPVDSGDRPAVSHLIRCIAMNTSGV